MKKSRYRSVYDSLRDGVQKTLFPVERFVDDDERVLVRKRNKEYNDRMAEKID